MIELTDDQRRALAAKAAELLNAALEVDREGVTKLIRTESVVSAAFLDHPDYLAGDPEEGEGYALMSVHGLVNSLIGLVDGRGLIVRVEDSDTGEIIKFRVEA